MALKVISHPTLQPAIELYQEGRLTGEAMETRYITPRGGAITYSRTSSMIKALTGKIYTEKDGLEPTYRANKFLANTADTARRKVSERFKKQNHALLLLITGHQTSIWNTRMIKSYQH